jgi:hypothetical protein
MVDFQIPEHFLHISCIQQLTDICSDSFMEDILFDRLIFVKWIQLKLQVLSVSAKEDCMGLLSIKIYLRRIMEEKKLAILSI